VTEGSGLGLSITRALIQAQGGTVSLRDAAPSGLCVRLNLPTL
jgi:signal transduction histidine kinase